MEKIKSVLISVFNKEGIDDLCRNLHQNNIAIISTGGTKKHIEKLNIPVTSVESLTDFSSILGGRVKTLHPKIFGAILSRRDNPTDLDDIKKHNISKLDMVIVDLYPFQETVESGKNEEDIIEKIDIGGVSLIRAAAKNFSDVLIVSSRSQYSKVLDYLLGNNFSSDINFRKRMAFDAFYEVSNYDSEIEEYFGLNTNIYKKLRYGENPHQKAIFKGNIDDVFDQINGKELSYNNLLDVDSAVRLISEFDDPTFAILKHNNACGIASSSDALTSYSKAFDADPLSAFGGVLIYNGSVDKQAAEKINNLFFEIIIAPKYTEDSLEVLKSKKNRIILIQKKNIIKSYVSRDVLNGKLKQDADNEIKDYGSWKLVTDKKLDKSSVEDLEFANRIVKHSKSNAIVLVKDKQMLSSGVGQTSRIDALKFAIEKAKTFKFNLEGSVMASDAFFPFPDCIEIASEAGIVGVIQPGGSIKDDLSIDSCNQRGMSMYLSGTRHFYH
jgi:phosphoribosylaminoimidazolecarboxamide formyltransferase/IMP cyclohydrolase